METWNQLFIRHGWLVSEGKENVFDCSKETEENISFLLECLNNTFVSYSYHQKVLILAEPALSEEQWIEVVDLELRGRGGHLWFRPGKDEPVVRELDTYICGIVRQLNRLGFYTVGSCDGHQRRPAHVQLNKDCHTEVLIEVLHAIGLKRVHLRENRNGTYHLAFPLKRNQLLHLAEQLGMVKAEWLGSGCDLKEQLFYLQLEELLSVPGESGNEDMIRQVVQAKLAPFVDKMTVDRHGNLLAEKTYRSGNGPTILVNAHLDMVEELVSNREIVKHDGIWSSTKGILGADDRAGVGVILHVAQELALSNAFSGKIKYIFTVKEEVGLVGAKSVDHYFLWGTDAAIVVDRRGTGDIVTSCGGYIPFCDEVCGEFFEKVAKDNGLGSWTCTTGASSDTRMWAEHGLQSVNLSVGYNFEHTEMESLDAHACYQTAQLILASLAEGNELRRLCNQMKRGDFNHQVKIS